MQKSFFKVQKTGKDYCLLTPVNNRFVLKAVNVIRPSDPHAPKGERGYDVLGKYKDKREWAKATAKRLQSWGFNTIGCWSDPALFECGMPFTVILDMHSKNGHRLVDVFDKEFSGSARKAAEETCGKYKDDINLVGYFMANELPWYGDLPWETGHVTWLLDEYLKLDARTNGKKQVIDFFKSRYALIGDFNRIWSTSCAYFPDIGKLTELPKSLPDGDKDREDFCAMVAEKYFSTMVAAVRKIDPHHLVMGDRMAGLAPDGVLSACGKYCDVVSLNYYPKDMVLPPALLQKIFELTGNKPLLITEFSYRAMENNSGDLNTKGADVTVQTQQDRAAGFEKYVTQLMEFPFTVGYCWFQYYDQPPKGRSFDGEDSNYGIVDLDDNEYAVLTEKMREVNRRVERTRKDSR